MRVPTSVPALLLLALGIAVALLGVGASFAVANALGQRCIDCPIDRSGQFVTIFFVYAVVLFAIAALHALIALGVWRGGRWAIKFGVVLSALGLVILVLFWPPSYWLAAAAAAAAYGVALVGLLFARLEPGM